MYEGPKSGAPAGVTLPEEELGVYERQLLKLCGGEPNVYAFAEGQGGK